MMRLCEATLARLPSSTRTPAYDHNALRIGHAHIGVGAFHRCHQAEFVEDMLEAQFGPWGIVGINLRPPRIADALAPQDFLYTRTLREEANAETRAIGCLRRVVEVSDAASAQAAIETLAASAIEVVTLTVTEKGYCLTPASGELDRSNPDLAADLANAQPPRTALALLAAALARRRQFGAGPVTLMSCDNIPANGRRLQAALLSFAAEREPSLVGWIEANVAFPCSMVDRIVPATTSEDRERLAAALGLQDEAAVVGEPFRQWVVEDRFAGRRPPWELGGVQFVADAEPFERIKMRVLNAAQSALSHGGALLGHEFSWQAARDPILSSLVERMLRLETEPTLPRLEGLEVEPYIANSLRRIANPALHHRCHQIGTDGSQKLGQRLLGPLRERLAQGLASPGLECAVAGWIAYVAAGSPARGARWRVVDPYADAIAERAGAHADATDLARAVLSIAPIFGDLVDEGLTLRVGRHLAGWLGPDVRGYLTAQLRDA